MRQSGQDTPVLWMRYDRACQFQYKLKYLVRVQRSELPSNLQYSIRGCFDRRLWWRAQVEQEFQWARTENLSHAHAVYSALLSPWPRSSSSHPLEKMHCEQYRDSGLCETTWVCR